MVLLLIALLPITFVGLDPVVVLTPVALFGGIVINVIPLRRMWFPLSLYAGGMLCVSGFTVSLFMDPVRNWAIRLIAGGFFFYMLILFVDSTERMRRIFLVAVLGMIVASGVALGALLGFWRLGPMFFPVFGSERFAGLYNTTILAIYTALMLIWVIDETYQPKLWRRGRFLKLLLILGLFVQLLSTLTRSAWVGLLVGLTFHYLFVLYSSRAFKKIMVLGVAMVVGLGAVVFIAKSDIAAGIRARVYDDSLNPSEDEQKRAGFYFTRNALTVAASNPLGVGLGNTQKHTERFNEFEVGAHNTFVMVLSDLGWVTFTGFLIVQWVILSRLFVMALRGGQKFGVSARMLFSSCLCLGVAAMFQDLLYYMPMWLVPALAAVVLFGRPKTSSAAAPVTPKEASSRG